MNYESRDRSGEGTSNQYRHSATNTQKNKFERSTHRFSKPFHQSSEESLDNSNADGPKKVDNAFVKFTSGSIRFEDLKSTAMNSWDEGIDLELKRDNKKKNKAQWASEEDIFKDCNVDFFKQNNNSKREADSHERSMRQQQETAPTWNNNEDLAKKSYAEATDPMTPSWAVDDVSATMNNNNAIFQVPFLPQQFAYSADGTWSSAMMPASVPMIPHNMAPPIVPVPVIQPNYMPVGAPSSTKDKDLALFLYKFLHDPTSDMLPKFLEMYEKLLPNMMFMPPRTLGHFMEVLSIVLEEDEKQKDYKNFNKIQSYSRQVFSAVDSFIKHLLIYPDDAIQVIRFVGVLSKFDSSISEHIALQDFINTFKSLQDYCSVDQKIETIKQLQSICPVQGNGDSWYAFSNTAEEGLLPIPAPEDIVLEAAAGNMLLSYELAANSTLSNIVKGPWPKLDFQNYLFTHYMLRRQEFVEPMQNAIKNMLTISSADDDIQNQSETTICHGCRPVYIIPFETSYAPSIVFSIDSSEDTDDIINDNTEGSFALIIPELNYTSMTKEEKIEYMAKSAMMGHIMSAFSHQVKGNLVRLINIQIYRKGLPRLDWSCSYTVITSRNNAPSTFSVLHWLKQEFEEFHKHKYSAVITPRLLAFKNSLSADELGSWNEYARGSSDTNDNPVPEYLQRIELDISCIMINKQMPHKAKPDENIWPSPTEYMWNAASPPKRPPVYELSPSQMKALKYALTHRIACISGSPGAGKTYLAAKLALLMSQALSSSYCRQPLLIIAKSQSTLDRILGLVAPKIRDTVRFGYEPKDSTINHGKFATQMALPELADNGYKQFKELDRRISGIQTQLDALCKLRLKVESYDPETLYNFVHPKFGARLQQGYSKMFATRPATDIDIWKFWLIPKEQIQHKMAVSMESEALLQTVDILRQNTSTAGNYVMPTIDYTHFQNKCRWIAGNTAKIEPVSTSSHWPFETSKSLGSDLRDNLVQIWKEIEDKDIWTISEKTKDKVINKIADLILDYIDRELHDLIKKQSQAAEELDHLTTKRWAYVTRFNRVIGITADFAAAHQSWLTKLWPRCVIVDEASEILESTLMPIIVGPRVEHLVLLGNAEASSRPHVSCNAFKGNPRYMDTSLFERWKKNSASEVVRLEEQWRMHSEVANILDKFNSNKDKASSLLITAPLATCNENMRDSKQTSLMGLTHRMFYIDYQPSRSPRSSSMRHVHFSSTPIAQADIDEAQFIAHLATYIIQQPYSQNAKVAVLTMCNLQKHLIRNCLKTDVPKRTMFSKNLDRIVVERVDQHPGRDYWFTIISTATPGRSRSLEDNLSEALTKAKYGIYIVGKPTRDTVHPRWQKFAYYMCEIGLYGTRIPLVCYQHGERTSVGYWTEFQPVRNGGCSRPCNALMSDGHVCPEICHYGSHNEVVCRAPCTRPRPTLCTHECPRLCFECNKEGGCPDCLEEIAIELPCGHEYKGQCKDTQRMYAIKCLQPVKIALPRCKHKVTLQCCNAGRASKIICNVKEMTELSCGHRVEKRCSDQVVCGEVCNKLYECGLHSCQEMCGSNHSHARMHCPGACLKELICGHRCAKGCSSSNDHTQRCLERCNYVCLHGYKCSRPCFSECIMCVNPCPYQCEHYKCTKRCYEPCDRPACNEPCKKRLDCSHPCRGFCGEPCPPCGLCHPDIECSITLRTLSEFDPDEKVYMLPECGCVFSAPAMDTFFKHRIQSGEHSVIKLWECPNCKKNIYTAHRYNQYIKHEVSLVNEVKRQIEDQRQKLTPQEKNQIICAMNEETKSGMFNIVGGRWFVCPNKHPYFVGDCGGATEVSRCPECNAPIGGTQHRVIESNRFYGEFDGSEEPAWPGQPSKSL
ncbi:hypothetical protein RMATCC62417_13481 [Rhizopus microsporus]|nr:hypothetical protein RMATCC62417_13481 [Rhizopus microsporus]